MTPEQEAALKKRANEMACNCGFPATVTGARAHASWCRRWAPEIDLLCDLWAELATLRAQLAEAEMVRAAAEQAEMSHFVDCVTAEAENAKLRATIEAQRTLVGLWRELEGTKKEDAALFVRTDAAAYARGFADGIKRARWQLAATLPPQAE